MAYCINNYCCALEVCQNLGIYNINSSSFHKLCESHSYLLTSSTFLQCGYCNSTCLITNTESPLQPINYCSICSINEIQDLSTSRCSTCLKICNFCKGSENVLKKRCNLIICQKCSSFSCCGFSCSVCFTDYQTYRLECGKIMCQSCFSENECCERLCFLCKEHRDCEYTGCGRVICRNCLSRSVCCQNACSSCKNHFNSTRRECGVNVCFLCDKSFICCFKFCPECKVHVDEFIDLELKTCYNCANFDKYKKRLSCQIYNRSTLEISENSYDIQTIKSLKNRKSPKIIEKFKFSNEKNPIFGLKCSKSEEIVILDCNHKFCNDFLNPSISACPICYPEDKICMICTRKGYQKLKFSKCDDIGCTFCKIYEYCFACLSDMDKKILKNNLQLEKLKINCNICEKIQDYAIEMICKHFVCLSCCQRLENFDYLCLKCYEGSEIKTCVRCKNSYELRNFEGKVYKNCCKFEIENQDTVYSKIFQFFRRS